MLHIRVVSPANATGQLLARLAVLPGIQNLIVLEGAARRPDGDAVLFDLQPPFEQHEQLAARDAFAHGLLNFALGRDADLLQEPAQAVVEDFLVHDVLLV